MKSLDVTSQCTWSFVEQRQCSSFVLKRNKGKPEPFEDGFRLAIVLYKNVDQPAIYRTQVKVTKKQNSWGNKENTVDKKLYAF